MRTIFLIFSGLWRPRLTSEVQKHLFFEICMSRAFRNGMTLAFWMKIEVSRALWSFDSDLSKFSEKVSTSRMASFRGQEIFPMVSGDAPRCTKEVSRKKTAIFFSRFKLLSEIWETPPHWACPYRTPVLYYIKFNLLKCGLTLAVVNRNKPKIWGPWK